jgi:hypothetical protein
MFTWTIRCDAASVTTSNEVERMPRIRNGTFSEEKGTATFLTASMGGPAS